MKSTPINQLPNNATKNSDTKHPITENTGHVEEYANNQKAHENFKPPIDTSVNMNIDDDISINDVMSELNDNRTIELNETARLQEQINMLQTEIQNQRRHNDSLNNQNVFVPQAPSARLVNQESMNTIEALKSRINDPQTTQKAEESKGMFSQFCSSFTGGAGDMLRFFDLKLFIVVCVASVFMFSTMFDNFLGKHIKDSKYCFIKEPLKVFLLAVVVVGSIRI